MSFKHFHCSSHTIIWLELILELVFFKLRSICMHEKNILINITLIYNLPKLWSPTSSKSK